MVVPSLRTKKTEPNAEQVKAVDFLIESMNLMDVSEVQPGIEAFANNKILNPATQHMYRVLTHRALYPNQPIPMVDSDLNEHLNIPAKLKATAAAPLETLKTLYPLKRIVKHTKEQFFDRIKKIHSTSNTENPIAPNDGLAVDDGPIKDESRLVEVGTMTPAEDFGELLRRGEKFSTLCEQIQAVITDLVLKAVRLQTQKVSMAIMVYREEARLIGAYRYNEWIVEFKRLLLARRKLDVWQEIVVNERMGLITEAEAESSTVSEQEAQAFYELSGIALRQRDDELHDSDDGDIDDLIGNM